MASDFSPAQHQHAQRLRSIRDAWNARAAGQGLKPKGARYFKAQLEFLVGANAGLLASGHQGIEFLCTLVAVGRDINELVKETPQ